MSTPYLFERVLCPSVEGNPRNGEGDIVLLADGRLLMVYGEFYGGGDGSAATLQGQFSEDNGRTWSGKHTVQENVGGKNVMSVSLLALPAGDVLLFYLRKDTERTLCTPFVRRSSDNGLTWSAPEPLVPPREPFYYVVNNNRAVRLRGGRLLVPACVYENWNRTGDRVFFSDDDGRSWKATAIHPFTHPEHGPLEPGVIELKDGRVMMWCRTGLRDIFACYSADGGETFGPWRALGLKAPNAPASMMRLPSTGHLLCIFNNHAIPRDYWGVERSPLTAAVSADEGETWRIAGDLEPDRTTAYCYTSITFLPDREVLLSYYMGRNVETVVDGAFKRRHYNLSHLKVAVFKEDWLYREAGA